MPDERRYTEEEVAWIFEAAAEDEAQPAPGSTAPVRTDGLTLAELQSIGRRVGLAPERVAEAAAAVEVRLPARRRTDLGMPVSTGRTVTLPRAPTDREWEIILSDLRETFGARGRVVESWEDVREWRNGNLHARVEPTAAGSRLRLGSTSSNALALNRVALATAALALVLALPLLLRGVSADTAFAPLALLVLSLGALALNAVRTSAWVEEREAQMEEVAARARALLETAPPRG